MRARRRNVPKTQRTDIKVRTASLSHPLRGVSTNFGQTYRTYDRRQGLYLFRTLWLGTSHGSRWRQRMRRLSPQLFHHGPITVQPMPPPTPLLYVPYSFLPNSSEGDQP